MRKRHADHPGLPSRDQSFKKNLERLYREEGIHPKYAKCRISDFEGDVLAQLTKYTENIEQYMGEGMGLYVYGGSGVGKTHMVYGLYAFFLSIYKDSKVVAFETLLTQMFLSWKDREARSAFVNMYQKPNVLFIEDFGNELAKADKSSPSKVMDTVLKTRAMNGKVTIITSQIAPGFISEDYDEALSSLMKEYCFPISLEHLKDRRKSRSLLND